MKINRCKECGCTPIIRFHGVENSATCACSMKSCSASYEGKRFATPDEALNAWNSRQEVSER